MARSIGMAKDATVFRAVIHKRHDDGREYTSYEGPYGEAPAAKARVTFWKNYFKDYGYGVAEGYVESGTVTWSKI